MTPRKKGTVYLVGAGPGDPGLLTLHGKTCLEKSQIIVYDALVHPDILKHTQKTAKKIHVGKRGNRSIHTEQNEIHQILKKNALTGKSVTRLKGGDPFLFGRGGEEAEFLAQEKIPFQIVPGVSSLTAVPAYAGIPVTDRRFSSMLTVITGHSMENKNPELAIDWDNISPNSSLVVLMGISNLSKIIAHLLKRGWSPQTPSACIRWGTWKKQTQLQGTLKQMKQWALKAHSKIKSPSIFIVGSVVELSSSLSWFKKWHPQKKES